jgi:hypothetical protein
VPSKYYGEYGDGEYRLDRGWPEPNEAKEGASKRRLALLLFGALPHLVMDEMHAFPATEIDTTPGKS